MHKTRKSLLPRYLNTYDVYVEDRSSTSDYFRVSNLPSVFTGGRNSFLLGTSPFLKNQSNILIEILDTKGNPVYQTPVNKFVESTSKLISVEVYGDTPTGFGTIIIMGVATHTIDGTPVPFEWENKYNVRWSGRILIDGSVPNTSPIRFESTPEAFLSEIIFKSVVTASYTTQEIPFTASLDPMLFSSLHNGYGITARGPTTFSSDHYNGILTGSLIVAGQSTQVQLPITNILRDTTAFSKGYVVTTGTSQIRSILLYSGSYTASVDGTSLPVTSSVKLRYETLNTPTVGIDNSFASIRVINIRTVSGELRKLRIYVRPATDFAEYKLVGDIVVNTTEIMTSASNRGPIGVGDFIQTTNVSDNWYAGRLVSTTGIRSGVYAVSGSADYYTPPTVSEFAVTLTDKTLLRSIYADVPVVGSLFTGSVSSSGYFIGTREPVVLFPSTEYRLSFDAVYNAQSGSVFLAGNMAQVDIYVMGNVVDENPLGQRIGRIRPTTDTSWYEDAHFIFSPELATQSPVSLRFVVSNGFWNFSNISLKPASEVLFSPDEVQVLVPNTEYRNKVLQYKVEFFDVDNNSTHIDAVATPRFFSGSAMDLGTFL